MEWGDEESRGRRGRKNKREKEKKKTTRASIEVQTYVEG